MIFEVYLNKLRNFLKYAGIGIIFNHYSYAFVKDTV